MGALVGALMGAQCVWLCLCPAPRAFLGRGCHVLHRWVGRKSFVQLLCVCPVNSKSLFSWLKRNLGSGFAGSSHSSTGRVGEATVTHSEITKELPC